MKAEEGCLSSVKRERASEVGIEKKVARLKLKRERGKKLSGKVR